MLDSASKVILVTGAYTGLGRAMASHLSMRGHRVYGTSRQLQPSSSLSWPMLQLDVRSDISVKSCVETLMTKEGRVDVLINNAGYAFIGAVEETTLEDARAQMETNFFGAVRMMMAVLPAMREQGSGRIINISSLSGVIGMPFAGAYAASKHALEGFSESLSHELHDMRIHMTLVEPDGMRTGIGLHSPRSDQSVLAGKRKRLLSMLQQATAENGSGNDPEMLARAVSAAIDSVSPPLRIVIGEKAQKLIAAKRTLPEREFSELLAELH